MKVKVNSCSDMLHSCAVVYPCNFDITTPINEKQKRYKGHIGKQLAFSQYNAFINLLQRLDVRTYFVSPIPGCNYQVFTRDIGFVIGSVLFISKMRKSIRTKETEPLKAFAKQFGLETCKLKNNAEGGDVFVLNNYVLIGVSNRTSESAVQEIKGVLASYGIQKEIIPLRFDTSKLHLDCVLGIVNEETAVVSPFLERESLETVNRLFKHLIEIDANTADELGTNFVSVNGETIVVTNQKVKDTLKQHGFNAVYVDYSEFIKAGGSVRCSILPLERTP